MIVEWCALESRAKASGTKSGKVFSRPANPYLRDFFGVARGNGNSGSVGPHDESLTVPWRGRWLSKQEDFA
jgi:hypothetical protein